MLDACPKKITFSMLSITLQLCSYHLGLGCWVKDKACFSYLESSSDVGDGLSFKISDDHGGKLAGNKLFGLSLSIWFPLNDSSTKLSQQWSFRASSESSVIWLQPITSSDLILC